MNIWNSNELSLNTKIRIFTDNIRTFLLYGVETQVTTTATIKKAQAFAGSYLRKILQFYYSDGEKSSGQPKRKLGKDSESG